MAKQADEINDTTILIGKHQNQGRRSNMEDYFDATLLTTASGLPMTVALVADGIGGNVCGEEAAKLIVDVTFREIKASNLSDPQEIPQLLNNALIKANKAVYEEARRDREKRGMGSTATLVAIHEEKLYLANVGDSRAYLIRDGQVHQLTRDHTWAYEMLRQNLISEQQVAKHPKAEELARSIGFDPEVTVDLGLYKNGSDVEETAVKNQGLALMADDRILLCSDGLIKSRHDSEGNYVEDKEIEYIVTHRAPQSAANDLVNKAVKRQADDNVSVIVLEMPNSKRAFYIPPAVLYGGVGLLVLILLGILGVTLFQGNSNDEPLLPTSTVVALASLEPATIAPPPPSGTLPLGIVSVINSGAGARWQTNNGQQIVEVAGELPLSAEGTPLNIQNSTGVLELALPDSSRLFIDENTEVNIEATLVGEGSFEIVVEIVEGRILLVPTAAPIIIANRLGSQLTSSGAIVGATTSNQPLRFEASCLLIGSCLLTGDLGGGIELEAGEASFVGGSGNPSAPEAAKFEQYYALAPNIVPAPTLTPTPTDTPTPTPTLTPTNTRIPPTLTPVPTNTLPPPTLTPIPPSGGNGGGGCSDPRGCN